MDETRKVHKSNHSQMFFKIGALKNFAIFTGKCLCWSLFLIKLQAYNFIKRRFQHMSFPMNIAKFLRNFYIKHFRSLLLVRAINKPYIPHNPISVGMRVYALQLKQKSTAAGFDGILRKFRSAFLKRKQKKRSKRSDTCGSRFSLFPEHLFIKSWNNCLSRQIFA